MVMENNKKICGCWFYGVAIGFPACYKEQKYITGAEYITQKYITDKNTYITRMYEQWINCFTYPKTARYKKYMQSKM